jgi:ubiquinone biosynthesis protein
MDRCRLIDCRPKKDPLGKNNMFFHFKQRYADLKRIRKIIRVFAKYGYGSLLSRVNHNGNIFNRMLGRMRLVGKPVQPRPTEVSIRLVLEELGPTFIKLGQMLSVRPDLIPFSYCDELSKLQDSAAPVDYDQIVTQLESELGHSPDELFREFNHKPIASASLSQVHEAYLHSGERVAVKIQRLNIISTIETDLHLCYMLAKTIARHVERYRILDPVGIVDEFSRSIHRELDFMIEASNINRFNDNFKDVEFIMVPKVFSKYTTSKILTMDFIDGIKVSDIARIDEAQLDKQLLARNGAIAELKMIFEDGFFHADPHPGNIFVLPGNKTLFLDFGMMGRLDDTSRQNLADLLFSFVARNPQRVTRALLKILGADFSKVDLQRLEMDIMDFVDRYYSIPLSKMRIGNMLRESIDIARNNHLKVPANHALLVKSLVMIEYVGNLLDPDLDFVEISRPFIENLISRRYSIPRMAAELKDTLEDLSGLLTSFPGDLHEILDKIKTGKLSFDLEHHGLHEFETEMDRSSNRIAFSVIVASIIVASSLIVQTGMHPKILGLPALGLIGFVLAGLLGLSLAIAIMRRGRL